jgi:hypothetical protein
MGSLDAGSSSGIDKYNPSVLEGRLGSGETPEDFIERLRGSQSVPCPWGSLTGMSENEFKEIFFYFS